MDRYIVYACRLDPAELLAVAWLVRSNPIAHPIVVHHHSVAQHSAARHNLVVHHSVAHHLAAVSEVPAAASHAARRWAMSDVPAAASAVADVPAGHHAVGGAHDLQDAGIHCQRRHRY